MEPIVKTTTTGGAAICLNARECALQVRSRTDISTTTSESVYLQINEGGLDITLATQTLTQQVREAAAPTPIAQIGASDCLTADDYRQYTEGGAAAPIPGLQVTQTGQLGGSPTIDSWRQQ
jgi:hypothetical protein